jgi:hypothetical protein
VGVTIDPAGAIEVPAIEKQSEGNAREWVERYASARR